ncbi:MAG: APC family permease [Planctomycetota bacterium]
MAEAQQKSGGTSRGTTPRGTLKRQVGIGGAVVLGLGSILGTGVFVSIGIAAGVTGPSVVLAVGVAALVAVCNGLSSAQLAANHPVAGGTYAYGYRYLTPELGFTAGWLFLAAKSASAATAALAVAGYGLVMLGMDVGPWVQTGIGLAVVLGLTVLVLGGLRRSNVLNAVLVAVTLGALGVFVGVAVLGEASLADWSARGVGDTADAVDLPGALGEGHRADFLLFGVSGFFEACALMFVAYTGYGRVATLGEEIAEPRKNIPRAVIATLVVTAVVYLVVTAAAVHAVGAAGLAMFTSVVSAPLEVITEVMGGPVWGTVVGIGAITAMLGVILNLLLGLSRVLLAMGREGDVPRVFGKVNASGTTPVPAVLGVAVIIAGLVLIGDVKTTWSFSAFTVLLYYGLTNWAALKLSDEERFYPRWVSVAGLIGCVGLAWWVDWRVLIAGVVLIAVALGLRAGLRREAVSDES